MNAKRISGMISLLGLGLGLMAGCGASPDMLLGVARDSVEQAVQEGVQDAIDGVLEQTLDPLLGGFSDVLPG